MADKRRRRRTGTPPNGGGTRDDAIGPVERDVEVRGDFEHERIGEQSGTFEAGVDVGGEFADLVRTRLAGPTAIRFGPRTVANAAAGQLWEAIRFYTDQISFPAFAEFIDSALCVDDLTPEQRADIEELDPAGRLRIGRFERKCTVNEVASPFPGFIPGMDAYAALKLAAEIFLILRCGICPPPAFFEGAETTAGSIFDTVSGEPIDPGALTAALTQFLGTDRQSYIRGIIRNVFPDHPLAEGRFAFSPFCPLAIGFGPCLLELIWSYWHEQGMQAQTMAAIALRFQNVRLGGGRDPLAEIEIDPLRPLSGFLWGYIQDEPHRLTVARRAYEYNHHYGLSLYGKAVRGLRPADPRSKFLQSFHDLLRTTDLFYREAADNTVTPDAFPLLIALRDLHLILSEGAHNQFRDLPWTARVEMLIEQWLLARTEMRDFLRGRHMVPYREAWMGAVDAMKKLQGWTDTNITHFNDLARYGERILLSVRYISWNTINDPQAADDWAVFWRPEIQGYLHAYRSATGVSLSDDIVDVARVGDARYLQPSFHLRNRLQEQRPGQALPPGGSGGRLQLGPVSRADTRKR